MKNLNHTMIEAPLQVILFKLFSQAGSPRTGSLGLSPAGFGTCQRMATPQPLRAAYARAGQKAAVWAPSRLATVLHSYLAFLGFHLILSVKTKSLSIYPFICFFISVATEHLTGMSSGKGVSEQRESGTSQTVEVFKPEFQYVCTRGPS